uniref:Wax synthase domain-containing protein n=1 Tax=Kalanchoe fedtschenkoi TaxID=63787 RepID=A0A7N0TNU5_KALFE
MEPYSEIITLVCISLTYCFVTGKLVPAGKMRFLLISPLMLFSFNKGPLSADPSISLPRFLAATSLPIKITPKSDLSTSAAKTDQSAHSAMGYALRAVLLAVVFKLYDYKAWLHPTAILFLYSLHLYFMLELLLAVVGAAARAGFGLELEPQFNEPYLATSILRPSVYEPVTNLLSGPMGPEKAQPFAVLATFGVSAIMHELIMFYLNRLIPTGEMSAFFLLHGACVVAERAVARRMRGRWKVPRLVASCLTIWFVLSTGFWLFYPEFLQGKALVRAFEEYAVVGEFLEKMTNGTLLRSFAVNVSIHKFFQHIRLSQ